MIKEQVAELIYGWFGGDTDFNTERGYHPCADLADENADQIHSLYLSWFREMVKGMKNPYPQPYANSAIEECQRVAWASCQSQLQKKMKRGEG